jgi:hypothetical protein
VADSGPIGAGNRGHGAGGRVLQPRFATSFARSALPTRFSNRPIRVKRFQTIHHFQCRCRSRARASLRNRHRGPSSMGFEDEVEQSLGRPCRQATVGPSGLANSPHPSSREGHHSTARWSSSVLLSHWMLSNSHVASTSRVQRNSVPSTQMRCMITANRRASATIAFFFPRCLAIFIAQALSQDHLLVLSMLWAAS